MDPDMRIGDAERDEAIRRLGEHHGAGRITIEEFDNRVEDALEAVTARDLDVIFRDLPGRPFDLPEPPMHTPVSYHPTPAYGPMQTVSTRVDKPFFQSGSFFWLLFLVVLMTGFRLWPLLVIGGIWVLIVGPALGSVTGSTTVQQFEYRAGDVDGELRALVRANRPIEAMKRYREVHGVGLKEAKDAIDALQREERGIGY